MTRISCSISTLDHFRYSIKTLVALLRSKGSNYDSSLAQLFLSRGICLTMISSNFPHICSTNPWYFASKGSLTSYSSKTCRAMICKLVKSTTFPARIVSLKLENKASYSTRLLMIENLNLIEYLNSSFSSSTRRILASPPF